MEKERWFQTKEISCSYATQDDRAGSRQELPSIITLSIADPVNMGLSEHLKRPRLSQLRPGLGYSFQSHHPSRKRKHGMCRRHGALRVSRVQQFKQI